LRGVPDPYLITWDQEFADKVPEMNGYYRPTLVIPAGTVGANQPEPVNVPSVADYFVCYPELDPVIAYEIAKMQAEHGVLIAETTRFGFGASTPFVQKYLADEPFTRDDFHPGALKYFDEAGIQLP